MLTTVAFIVICWGTVLAMSYDAKMMLARGWK
jgi:hypothetical protein